MNTDTNNGALLTMSFQLCLLLVACSTCFTSSAVFGPTGQWLRNPSKITADDSESFSRILRLRGGEGEKKSTDKITGCCIGIDLGTTYRYISISINKCYSLHDYPRKLHHSHCLFFRMAQRSCVAVWKNGRVEICPNEQGNRITPSYVGWSSDGQRLVGDAAKNQAASNPINTVFDVKRLIGRKFSDASVQRDAKLFPFKSKINPTFNIIFPIYSTVT